MTKIIINNESIWIHKPFRSIFIYWKEITEFGKFQSVTRSQYGGSSKICWFYIKTDKSESKKIWIGNDKIADVNGLIETIFQKAINAEFVPLVNTSLIPFITKYETIKWDD